MSGCPWSHLVKFWFWDLLALVGGGLVAPGHS